MYLLVDIGLFALALFLARRLSSWHRKLAIVSAFLILIGTAMFVLGRYADVGDTDSYAWLPTYLSLFVLIVAVIGGFKRRV